MILILISPMRLSGRFSCKIYFLTETPLSNIQIIKDNLWVEGLTGKGFKAKRCGSTSRGRQNSPSSSIVLQLIDECLVQKGDS